VSVGESFAGYTIESSLGRGNTGDVYLARHPRLAHKVALEVVAAELAADEEFRPRFLRDTRLAASLEQPTVYDAGEFDGTLYAAMRYVAGPSLRTLLRERGWLSAEETLAIARQLGGALDAAHAGDLVHRDVKPSNVLVTASGEAVLCGFGLARRCDSHGLTRTGSFFGTADYAAPEQIEGRPLDGRADVYSLGCVLFECLTGRTPYMRDTGYAVLHAHLADPVPALSNARPDLPRSLDGVLLKAMAKRPEDRYARAGDLAAALAEGLRDEPGSAPVVVQPQRPRRRGIFAVVNRLAVRLGFVAILALLLAASSSGASTAPRPQIVVKPVPFSAARKAETRGYMRRHYGLDTWRLVHPHVIVEHYTASSTFASAYATFASNAPNLGELPGVCAHFVVDTDGTIYRLVPPNIVCRHTVGLNWTAIGIEHVGTSDAQILANERQLNASLQLTLWLMSRFHIHLRNVIGHNESLTSPYHHERVAAWRCQTHADWNHADMQIYRADLRRLAARYDVPLGATTQRRVAPAC
jgi:serine/threonine-protein kinase